MEEKKKKTTPLKVVGILGLGFVGLILIYLALTLVSYIVPFSSSLNQDDMSVAEEEAINMDSGSFAMRSSPRLKTQSVAPAAPSGELYQGERKNIQGASLDMLVEDMDSSIKEVKIIAEKYEGFLGSLDRNNATRVYAYVTIHVPSAKLDDALGELKKTAVLVNSENVTGRDVTEQFIDNDARLGNLKKEETKFLALMDQAARVEDMIKIENELSRIRSQIEAIEQSIKNLENQVSYSAVSISMEEEGSEADTQKGEWRPWSHMKKEAKLFVKSLQGFIDHLVSFFFGILAAIPYLILYGLTLIVVGLLVRYFWRLFRKLTGKKK